MSVVAIFILIAAFGCFAAILASAIDLWDYRTMNTDLYHLCFNCGFITLADKWELLKWDEEGNNLIPVEFGDMDPICRCPVCRFEHSDGDYGPGFLDGKASVLVVEREKAKEDWQDRWIEAEEEVFGI